MGMIGGRRSTSRSVVEHGKVRKIVEQTIHLAVAVTYMLQAVAAGRDGKVHGQYGERIDKQFETCVEHLLYLFRRSVLLAEETGARLHRATVNGRSG